jgi:5,10-methylene-tetrahydrofolate dehydrogenase/methenyl tetrahydrofolate cyclohydrolase
MALILDGKKARAAFAARLKEKIAKLPVKLRLAIIQVGEREESSMYIKQKIKFGQEIGAEVEHIKFPESASEREIINRIKSLNKDKNINGIIAQLPLPERLHPFRESILNSIAVEKDADGLSMGSKKSREEGKGILPATARGVMELLEFYKIPINGKKAAVLGRSILAGAPIAEAMRAAGAQVVVCHSKTPREEEIKTTKESGLVVAAIGKPKFLTVEFFAAGAGQVVVDVGINKIEGGRGLTSGSGRGQTSTKFQEEIPTSKFVGDVDFENVEPLVAAISPVPGGVGQMTVLALFENLYDCLPR